MHHKTSGAQQITVVTVFLKKKTESLHHVKSVLIFAETASGRQSQLVLCGGCSAHVGVGWLASGSDAALSCGGNDLWRSPRFFVNSASLKKRTVTQKKNMGQWL